MYSKQLMQFVAIRMNGILRESRILFEPKLI